MLGGWRAWKIGCRVYRPQRFIISHIYYSSKVDFYKFFLGDGASEMGSYLNYVSFHPSLSTIQISIGLFDFFDFRFLFFFSSQHFVSFIFHLYTIQFVGGNHGCVLLSDLAIVKCWGDGIGGFCLVSFYLSLISFSSFSFSKYI